MMLEQEKYEAMWDIPRYRQVSPGEQSVMLFLDIVKPEINSSVTDFGSGTGRGAAMLATIGKLQVQMLDFAVNCLDSDVSKMVSDKVLKFEQHDLTQPYSSKSVYGYCTDVMEHIPPHQVDKVIENILGAAEHIFFQIDTKPDICGALIGETLHLSVHPYEWWFKKLQELGAVIHWSNEYDNNCCFYLSGKENAKFDLMVQTVCNTPRSEIRENIVRNSKRKMPWLKVEPANDRTLAIVASGPSLEEYLPLLRYHPEWDILALNGAYRYLISHEDPFRPQYCMILDPREVNTNFLSVILPRTHFIFASQVHPSVIDAVGRWNEKSLVHLLDSTTTEVLSDNSEDFMYVGGGGTVGLTALAVAVGLGYRDLKLFGYDSSYRGNRQHVLYQEQNDTDLKFDVWVGDREFFSTAALVGQVNNFLPFLKLLIDEYCVKVDLMCDGLLPAYVEANN